MLNFSVTLPTPYPPRHKALLSVYIYISLYTNHHCPLSLGLTGRSLFPGKLGIVGWWISRSSCWKRKAWKMCTSVSSVSRVFWDPGFFGKKTCLGGGNSKNVYVHPYLGKIPILTFIFFQRGWNHQPDAFSKRQGSKFLRVGLKGRTKISKSSVEDMFGEKKSRGAILGHPKKTVDHFVVFRLGWEPKLNHKIKEKWICKRSCGPSCETSDQVESFFVYHIYICMYKRTIQLLNHIGSRFDDMYHTIFFVKQMRSLLEGN